MACTVFLSTCCLLLLLLFIVDSHFSGASFSPGARNEAEIQRLSLKSESWSVQRREGPKLVGGATATQSGKTQLLSGCQEMQVCVSVCVSGKTFTSAAWTRVDVWEEAAALCSAAILSSEIKTQRSKASSLAHHLLFNI